MFGFLSFDKFHDYIISASAKVEAALQREIEMLKGKAEEGAAKPNWLEKLAMLDQQYGWDEENGSDGSDTRDADNQQSTGNVDKAAVQDLPEVFNDEDEDWDSEDEDEYEDSDEEDDCTQPMSLQAYLYHRFGPKLRWEDRCSCCEFLVDRREERRKRDRAYFAEAGTCVDKDTCVLLPHRQADLPDTENVDKPVLMVTTPEGEELYPHDLDEYPEAPPASRDGKPLDSPRQNDYSAPYEEEDSPDI